jgi:uncharacterized protein (AIM24 family)
MKSKEHRKKHKTNKPTKRQRRCQHGGKQSKKQKETMKKTKIRAGAQTVGDSGDVKLFITHTDEEITKTPGNNTNIQNNITIQLKSGVSIAFESEYFLRHNSKIEMSGEASNLGTATAGGEDYLKTKCTATEDGGKLYLGSKLPYHMFPIFLGSDSKFIIQQGDLICYHNVETEQILASTLENESGLLASTKSFLGGEEITYTKITGTNKDSFAIIEVRAKPYIEKIPEGETISIRKGQWAAFEYSTGEDKKCTYSLKRNSLTSYGQDWYMANITGPGRVVYNGWYEMPSDNVAALAGKTMVKGAISDQVNQNTTARTAMQGIKTGLGMIRPFI